MEDDPGRPVVRFVFAVTIVAALLAAGSIILWQLLT
jgi:hypothetical protein